MEQNDNKNTDISLCFPRYGEKSDRMLIDIITRTKKTLDIAIFNFTDKSILKAILDARNNNVAVRIITDKTLAITPVQFFFLKQLKKSGISIKKNSHPGFMHMKITIADKKIVTISSANFTKSSQMKNDEFFMIIRDEKIASEFLKQFNLMWNNINDFTAF